MPWLTRAVGAGIAVMLVSSGVALLIAVRGHDANGGVTSAAPQASKSPAEPSPSAEASPAPSPSAASRPSPTPVLGPKPIARPPLTVLNNSTIDGLGADSAARFRSAGWTIADVGGLRGRYQNNTVYYDVGQVDAARLLMRQFPAITVIEPRSSVPNLPGRGLTVVVTRTFG